MRFVIIYIYMYFCFSTCIEGVLMSFWLNSAMMPLGWFLAYFNYFGHTLDLC